MTYTDKLFLAFGCEEITLDDLYKAFQDMEKETAEKDEIIAKLRELCRELLPSHGAICETKNSQCERCNIEKTLKELKGGVKSE